MSQDFIHQTIRRFQDRLLDLTARNRLLNFKFSERSRTQIRIVNDSPNRIYKRLSEGRRLELRSLPEPDGTPPDEGSEHFQQMLMEMRSTDEEYQNAIATVNGENPEQVQAIERQLRDRVRDRLKLPRLLKPSIYPTPQQQAQGLDINPAYDLLVSVSGTASNNLQTLLFPKDFERKASGLLDGARTSLQETGLNTLFLSFGMLEWFESESSNIRFMSPLLLYPVSIEREPVRGQYRYFIKAHEDEVEVNPCLRERLKRDFGLMLPDFQGEATEITDAPEAYFHKVEQLIEDMSRWQVRRFVTFSLFSFGSFALYKDLDLERWSDDGLASNRVIASLLGGEQREYETISSKSIDDYAVDEPEISRRVPLIISETDASQFSAIVDVMDGKNLVIEGPPGTGKSQTITNLIAAALAQGKKVLFVAEKMAAVEVVRDRIAALGLGTFCLELHSTNKPKSQVYKELKERCELQSPKEPANLNAVEREYISQRQKLTRYVQLLNQPFGEMGEDGKIHTIQEILWRAKGLQQEVEDANIPKNLLTLSVSSPQSLSRFDFDGHREALRQFSRIRTELEQAKQDLSIWEGINAVDLNPIEQEELGRSFTEWSRSIADIGKLYQDRAKSFDLPSDPTLGDIQRLDNLLATIPELPNQIEPALLMTLRDRAAVSCCRLFLQKYHEVQQLLQETNRFFENEVLESVNTEQIREFISASQALLQNHQLSQEKLVTQAIAPLVQQLWDSDSQNLSLWRRVLPTLENLRDLLKIEQDLTLADITHIDDILNFVESTPVHILRYRSPALCNPANRRILDRAASAQKQMFELNSIVRLELCRNTELVRFYADKLRGGWIFSFLDGDFGRAREFWVQAKASQQNRSDHEIADIFTRAANFWDKCNDLLVKDGIAEICGELYREFDTDSSLVFQVNDFGVCLEKLIAQASYVETIRTFILSSSDETLRSAVTYRQHPEFQSLLQACKTILSSGIRLNSTSSEILAILEVRKQESEQIYQNLFQLNLRADLSLEELRALVLQLDNCRRSQEDLNSPLFANVLGTYPQAKIFSPEVLKSSLDWAEVLQKTKLPKNIVQQCLSSNVLNFISDIQVFASQYRPLIQQQERYCDTALNLGKIDCSAMFGHAEILDCNITRVGDRLQPLSQTDELQRWISYSKVKKQIKSSNLWDFVSYPESINLTEEQLDLLYRMIFYRSLLSEIYRTHSDLRSFDGQNQQIARQRFQELDRELLRLHQAKLAARLAKCSIPPGIGRGVKKEWTEGSLINNEINKQTRHVALRSLFQRSGNALQALKPCWMMSPASVAQFIPSDSIRFDLIIIDEASQMRPEEALGVMARGQQLVVVGDPKQLPPTNFFKATDPDIEESEDVDAETLQEKSILDMAMKTFSVRRLKWHYRSRHESLIAFSNKHFYDNSLTVFPSPDRQFAIGYHHISEGRYQSGVNPIEVRCVAEAILEFMRNSSELSLGVVTLNQKQKDLLQDEISLLANTHPEVAEYIKKWDETLSSFFIKNLENVQGDERDVIFISTVYGRESQALPVLQRFGPINLANGHRRLNVLFTRAKERVEVFSSMTASDIRPTDNSSLGVKALRDYLEYVQTQQLETAKVTGREPDSDFERFVAKALRNRGFEVVAQVGVANYFIDLAIINPKRSGTYLLGIECDGATYHSAKAARDRDRYRQEVLERLGWQLYRIWSTDWFKNPDREISNLAQRIATLTK
jgi:very-short-patch-repair endonuclease